MALPLPKSPVDKGIAPACKTRRQLKFMYVYQYIRNQYVIKVGNGKQNLYLDANLLSEVLANFIPLLTVCWVVQMSAHNSGISEIPVGATDSPPCLVVAHLHSSLHHCLPTSKTYIPLRTTRIDYLVIIYNPDICGQCSNCIVSAYCSNELQLYHSTSNNHNS